MDHKEQPSTLHQSGAKNVSWIGNDGDHDHELVTGVTDDKKQITINFKKEWLSRGC
ncbi:hypothetical protein [Celerinatantimonas sp. YJH-8]|uniref:hypothetical protein n=1 Tax=Celerinatantimonas sp. YJH-8 TaxID=3228714 RepID=UPI0038CC103D